MSAEFTKVYCPLCKTLASATVESIPGTAQLQETEDGLEYQGETKVEWDGQKTERDDRGLTIFWCGQCDQEFACNPYSVWASRRRKG